MPLISELKIVIRALIFLLFTIIFGVSGFMVIEKHSFLNALYMTTITVSTVGFETIGGLSDQGKVFVIILIFLTLGTFLYAISVVTSFVVNGELRHLFKQYQVTKEVAKMRNHIIICGLGRNGREAARELIEQKVPFIAIESRKASLVAFQQVHQILAIEGDATAEDTLIKANIKEAKGIISCLPNDTDNVFVALSARELNPKLKIVARASQENAISKLRTAGANEVVVPNLIGGRKMANIMTKPVLVDFIDFISGQGNSKMGLEEVDCKDFPAITGKALRDLVKSNPGVLVLGFKDRTGGYHINPDSEKIFTNEDILFVMGKEDQINLFKKVFS